MTPPLHRVGLVIGHLSRGGAERQLATLALELRSRGVEPVVFCLSHMVEPFGSALRAAGIAVEMIPRLGPFDLSRVLRLARRFRARGVELAHSFLIDTIPYTVLAAALARVPTTVTSNLNSDFPRGEIRRQLDSLVFRRSQLVWVNSDRVKSFTSEFFRVPEDQIVVVRQGVDTGIFRPAENREQARKEAGLPDGLLLGTVGSLTAKKEPGLFLEIADSLLGDLPDLVAVHVGDGPLRHAIETLRERSPHRERIFLLGARDDVERLLPAFDLFLLTSSREGLPNVVLEAMACGVPVVAPNVGGCDEIVRNGRSGVLVTQQSGGGSFISAARSLLLDRAARQEMSREARHLAVEEHSLDAMTRQMMALYDAARAKARAELRLNPVRRS